MLLLPVLFFLSVPGSLMVAGDESAVLVYLDLETSGLSKTDCEILQIAAKAGDKEFDKFILPQNDISKRVSCINRITKSDGKLYYNDKEVPSTDVKEALISFLEFLKDVAAPINRVALVAHNGNRFDFPIILRDMNRYKLLEPFFEIVVSTIDTLQVLKGTLPNKKSYKLGTLAEQYGINTDDAHNGIGDVRILMEVIQKARIDDSRLKCYAEDISRVKYPQ